MKNGIISLGEAIIDFIPTDKNNTTYQKSPGGAPANVAVGAAKLGTPSYFIGSVGSDNLGIFMKETLASYNVNVSHMFFTDELKTGLTLVTLDDRNERTFEFYIRPSADSLLYETDIDERLFKDKKILHVGSISLAHEQSKRATWEAIRLAQKNNMLISFDPNIRMDFWESEKIARETILETLPFIDVLKLSEEEFEFLTGSMEDSELRKLMDDYNIPLGFVTRGAMGCTGAYRESMRDVPAMKVKAVDTTGAGDAFVSGILYQLNSYRASLTSITETELTTMMRFATVSGGLAASAKGAMSSLPTLKDVKKYLDEISF